MSEDDSIVVVRLREADARIAELEAALAKYGDHQIRCSLAVPNCSCGWRRVARNLAHIGAKA